MRGIRVSTVGVAVAAAALLGAPSALASDPPAQVSGDGHGTWQLKPGNPDTGAQRILHGHGHFSIGKAKVRGSVTAPGFIANGDCGVRLRLVTDTGSVTLAGHTKRTQGSYPSCVGDPYRFRFHTVKGTGDLADASYKGVGHFDLETASSDAADNGTFTLKLKPLS